MKTIQLEKLLHRKVQVVAIRFPYDLALGNEVRKITNISWSKSLKAWYAPYSIEVLKEIKTVFDFIAIIDASTLKMQVEKEKEAIRNKKELSQEALHQIERFMDWLRSRRYSENTVKTYSESLKTFLLYFDKKQIAEITNEDVIDFNNNYILKKELSASFQNQVVNAIKLFFRTMQHKKLDVDLVHRPKRAKVLPNVLSKEEVKVLLNSLSNVKHKAMLSLIYSCGLRRSELLNLKLTDIDSKRNLIIIRQAKGRKDRIAPLSLKVLELLRSYFEAYKPKFWLFEGQDKNSKYDERSLASVLRLAVEKSKIHKPVTLHWLRHSYATHLLENGTDLRYIQEILGHSSSKTTEIYTHVSNKSIQKIVSPFDTL
jgi:integrase/recombinase XerD